MNVTAPADVTVVSTGVEVGRSVEAGRQNTRFVAGAVRELTLQMSRDYKVSSEFVDGVKISSWYLERHAGSGMDVLRYGKEALKVFNSTFGPYPYTELDIVEAPLVGGAGGVEFPGLVTVASMFYAESGPIAAGNIWEEALNNNPFIKDTLEFVVAHEVAHEWWNAVVGSNSKKHPFIDEALANHSAIHYFRRVHGEAAAEKQIELQLKLPYQLARMVGAKDRPVDLPTAQFGSMMEYAAVVYGKGALFFDTMRRHFGEATHFRFLKDYYARHAFGIARVDDLIGGMVAATPDPGAAQRVADRWLKETHGDYDIGGLQVATLLKHLAGDIPLTGPLAKVIDLLNHKGAGELTKLVRQLITPEGKLKEDVNYGAILRLAGKLMGAEGDMGGVLDLAGKLLENNPGLLTGDADTAALLKGVAKTLAGDDKRTHAIIDATDAVLRLLSD